MTLISYVQGNLLEFPASFRIDNKNIMGPVDITTTDMPCSTTPFRPQIYLHVKLKTKLSATSYSFCFGVPEPNCKELVEFEDFLFINYFTFTMFFNIKCNQIWKGERLKFSFVAFDFFLQLAYSQKTRFWRKLRFLTFSFGIKHKNGIQVKVIMPA